MSGSCSGFSTVLAAPSWLTLPCGALGAWAGASPLSLLFVSEGVTDDVVLSIPVGSAPAPTSGETDRK
jgi:hypothetical protein